MNVVDTLSQHGTGALWLLPLLPPVAYLWVYTAFRCLGKLSVNAEGWHAGSVYCGRRVVLSALGLFGLFQPLLRLESGVARKFAALRGKPREQAVSDVVVEVIPMA